MKVEFYWGYAAGGKKTKEFPSREEAIKWLNENCREEKQLEPMKGSINEFFWFANINNCTGAVPIIFTE